MSQLTELQNQQKEYDDAFLNLIKPEKIAIGLSDKDGETFGNLVYLPHLDNLEISVRGGCIVLRENEIHELLSKLKEFVEGGQA